MGKVTPISYSAVLSPDGEQELMVLRDTKTLIGWRLGDIANAEANAPRNTTVPRSAVWAACASIVGASARTVREYAHIAAIFPQDARDEFAVLAFDHFRQAARLECNPLDALRWCIEQSLLLGRPATVDAMVAKFANLRKSSETLAAEAREFDGEDEQDNSPDLEQLFEDDEYVETRTEQWAGAVKTLRELTEGLPLGNMAGVVNAALNALDDALGYIRREHKTSRGE